jgi:hypothetical protein
MNLTPEIKIHLQNSDAHYFYRLLSKGFRIPFHPGCSIKDLLCKQLGIQDAYATERIQTIFLNGKAVDDIKKAIVSDESTLALSAAMPGLAGAVFRSGGRYSAMRESISYSSDEKGSYTESGSLELKLFNLVAREIGDVFLHRGIQTSGKDVCDIAEEHAELFDHPDSRIFVDQNKTDLVSLLSSDIKSREVWLKLLLH